MTDGKITIGTEIDTSEAEKDLKKLGDTADKSLKPMEKTADQAGDSVEELGDDSKKASESVDKLGDSSTNSAGALSKLGSVAKGAMKGAVAGLKAGVAGAAGLTTAFLATAEATRETRVAMGKVNTAFTTMGYSAETGKKTFMDFAAILGDTDTATEAVGNLAKLATSEEDLTKWTTIATGVYATFGDGLPIEGLTEAANETAKVAQVTGPLADAINWATTNMDDWEKALGSNQTALEAFKGGIAAGENAEDSFNLALQSLNSEQERSQLITATLSSLYGDAAKTYEETSGSILDANRAQAELNDAMAQIGEVAEPVMAALKSTGATMLNDLLPSVQLLGEGLQDVFNGDMGGTDKIGQAVGDMLTSITDKVVEYAPQLIDVGIRIIESIISGISENPDKIAEAAIDIVVQLFTALTQMIPQIIELGLQLVIALAQGITENVDTIVQAFVTMIQELAPLLSGDNLTQMVQVALQLIQALANSLVENLPVMLDAFMQIFTSLVNALPDIIAMIVEALPQLIQAIVTFLSTQIPTMIQVSIQLFMALVKAIPQIVTALAEALPDIIVAIIEGLQDLAQNLWDDVLEPAIDKFVEFASNAKDKAVEAGKNFLSGIMENIQELPSKVKAKVDEIIDKIANFASDFADKAKQAASDFKDKLVNGVKELPDKMLEIGGNIVSGIWDGINNKFDWLTGKIKSFANNVTEKLKSFFGIHSPSRVMRDKIGKYISLGIAEGIKQNEKAVTDVITELSESILAELKNNMSEDDFKAQGSKLVKKLTEGINSQISNFKDKISTLTSTYKSAVDSIKSKQSDLQLRLFGWGNLYTEDAKTKKITLSNLNQQANRIIHYERNLAKLKKKTNQGLLNQIVSMGVEEGSKLAETLTHVSDAELAAYNKAYARKEKVANRFAKRWYSDDLKTMKTQYTIKVGDLMNGLVNDVGAAGTNAVNSFLSAFKGTSVESAVTTFCNNITNALKEKFNIEDSLKIAANAKKVQTQLQKADADAKKQISNFNKIHASTALKKSDQIKHRNELATSTRYGKEAVSRAVALSQAKAQEATTRGIDYNALGKATAKGIKNSGLSVQIDGRKAGRVIGRSSTPNNNTVGGLA